MIEIRRCEHLDRPKAGLRQPLIEHLHDALVQRLRLHDPAVEEHMRGTGEAARTTTDCRRLRSRRRCSAGRIASTREKTRQVPRHCRVGGIRQT